MDQKSFEEAISEWYVPVTDLETGRVKYERTKRKKWVVYVYAKQETKFELVYGRETKNTPKYL
jgi:hypothetical protein